jgi:predicted GH43/DUF377 family glycosyl hydrolase
MRDDPKLVRRGSQVLRADPSRVVVKLFLPGQETLAHGISRADAVVQRVLAMTDDEVSSTLGATERRFAGRHRDLRATFAEHFALVAHRVPKSAEASAERRDLIGAYFTQEYSVEAAALFNPSMVAHPDQSGLAEGELRFIISVRAVGEGHISSVEFRTGILSRSDGTYEGAGDETRVDEVRVDEPGSQLVVGRATPAAMSTEFLRQALAERSDAAAADHLLSILPARFEPADLDAALRSVARDKLTRGSADAIIERVRWIASCNYRLQFPDDHELSERVIYPVGVDESHGIEDVRLVRFANDDASLTYYATYTAFDGSRVAPHLLQTDDFKTFDSTQLIGPAAKNKGMALFPRRVGGRYLALSRWDRESIAIASSADNRNWGAAVTVQTPEQSWELIQLGNCGSPIETEDGWLVLTHGVGAMREYAIGAILLDLDDPSTMVGALDEPILTPTAAERDGYVPNVVYSCGALLHGDSLVLPYGCSDSHIRIAFIDMPELLKRLRASRLRSSERRYSRATSGRHSRATSESSVQGR